MGMALMGGVSAAAAIVFHGLPCIPYRGMVQGMDAKLKKSQLARLGRIEGQVRGIARMIEEERYCIDVLTQVRAVRAALNKVEQETLADHLQHCVAHAFHAGSEKDRIGKIEEILEVLDSRRR
jgi:DNA-binding FrmR family transcriptional regulator